MLDRASVSLGVEISDKKRLRELIERVERIHEERAALGDDLKEIFAQAKSLGFDVAIMKQVLKLRRMGKDEREQQQELVDLYLAAIEEDDR